MQKSNNKKQLMVETIEKVKKSFPYLDIMNINHKIIRNGEHETSIELKCGRQKLSARKKGTSLQKSLSNTRNAILRQLEKLKKKNSKYSYRNYAEQCAC